MPAIEQISKFVRSGLVSMLAHPSNGFNAQLATVAPTYNIVPYQIDFTGNDGTFCQGLVSPDQVEQAEAFKQITDATSLLQYAFMSLDTTTESDIGLTLDSIFGGDVQAQIQLTLSFTQSSTIPAFADWADAAMWAVRTCLSNPAYQGYWPAGLIYNRVWATQKTPILFAGSNWRQTIVFYPKFKVIAH